jgi:hypothetical protein
MVSQRARIAATSTARNPRISHPGSLETFPAGFFSIQTPSSGAKITATSQESIRASPTTTKIEKVYSPAALRAKPMGTKPAAVMKLPVSIGAASVR